MVDLEFVSNDIAHKRLVIIMFAQVPDSSQSIPIELRCYVRGKPISNALNFLIPLEICVLGA